jgi:hypothetical protein
MSLPHHTKYTFQKLCNYFQQLFSASSGRHYIIRKALHLCHYYRVVFFLDINCPDDLSILTTKYAFPYCVVCSLHTLCSLQPDKSTTVNFPPPSDQIYTSSYRRIQTSFLVICISKGFEERTKCSCVSQMFHLFYFGPQHIVLCRVTGSALWHVHNQPANLSQEFFPKQTEG